MGIAIAAACLVLLVLLAAWIDGGEVPLHPIVQKIETPESLR